MGGFGGTAIILKSQALSIKVKPYIEAARVAGGGHFHIIFVHIIPNLLPLSLLYMMFTVTSAIFAEAVLSFLGLLDLRMSWGIMIHTANTGGYLMGRHPLLVAGVARRRVHHPAVQRLLPGRSRPGRSSQPPACAGGMTSRAFVYPRRGTKIHEGFYYIINDYSCLFVDE